MNITVPDEIAAQTGCSDSDLLFELALGLFLDGRLTSGAAAAMTGVERIDFLEKLGKRHIPMPYGEAELNSDLRTLQEVFNNTAHR